MLYIISSAGLGFPPQKSLPRPFAFYAALSVTLHDSNSVDPLQVFWTCSDIIEKNLHIN